MTDVLDLESELAVARVLGRMSLKDALDPVLPVGMTREIRRDALRGGWVVWLRMAGMARDFFINDADVVANEVLGKMLDACMTESLSKADGYGRSLADIEPPWAPIPPATICADTVISSMTYIPDFVPDSRLAGLVGSYISGTTSTPGPLGDGSLVITESGPIPLPAWAEDPTTGSISVDELNQTLALDALINAGLATDEEIETEDGSRLLRLSAGGYVLWHPDEGLKTMTKVEARRLHASLAERQLEEGIWA